MWPLNWNDALSSTVLSITSNGCNALQRDAHSFALFSVLHKEELETGFCVQVVSLGWNFRMICDSMEVYD